MLAFNAKLGALEARAAGSDVAGSSGIGEDSFAHPRQLGPLLIRVDKAMRQLLPELSHSMTTYLPNPATRQILFQPIR